MTGLLQMTITIMVYNINLNGRGRGRVTSIVFKGHEKCFTVALHIPQYTYDKHSPIA